MGGPCWSVVDGARRAAAQRRAYRSGGRIPRSRRSPMSVGRTLVVCIAASLSASPVPSQAPFVWPARAQRASIRTAWLPSAAQPPAQPAALAAAQPSAAPSISLAVSSSTSTRRASLSLAETAPSPVPTTRPPAASPPRSSFLAASRSANRASRPRASSGPPFPLGYLPPRHSCAFVPLGKAPAPVLRYAFPALQHQQQNTSIDAPRTQEDSQ